MLSYFNGIIKGYDEYKPLIERINMMDTVVCYGDSIACGNVDVSYFEMLKDEFMGKANFINIGCHEKSGPPKFQWWYH